ncbi:LacI family DNA-binding transcriptional regulator [Parachryseolinea silvisoli]|uniref:LacI family DNA-binding transcriptional regulator n=1 Tax=Parachryseolinea silvisoli TaxID=2873601 RepID=UPI002265D478|nr:LacI family DNA-binding transcriptional regulator [Parachryseolinea silvisoli]MCD9018140.1 LacI family transcriptional regulator [Parachryseolinea silvisoli]
MGVTIKKIAADLNLAVSTVSKALRDSYEISPETKMRVFEYAARLNYVPNLYASSLKRRRSGNIAVVLPEVADSFFSSAIDGIEEVAQSRGYHVMVYLTHEDVGREQSIVHEFRNGRVDGVLMSVVANEATYDHLVELGGRDMPLVFFDRVCEGIHSAQVVTDDFESARKATQHLIDRGSKRLAFLSLAGDLAIIRLRQEGYQQALRDNGLDEQKNPVVYCTHTEADNLPLIRKLLQGEHRPDGIVGSVEKVATQTYTVCHELNLSIPTQVRVVGFSHLQIAGLLNPSLTTITQPAFEMGKAAATLLFRGLEEKADVRSEKIIIPSVLVARQSTA